MIRKDGRTGDAWLSSVRSVRSALKWDNERNPCRLLQVSDETAPSPFFTTQSVIYVNGRRSRLRDVSAQLAQYVVEKGEGEEGGADVKSARPLCPGLHTCYNEI